MQRGQLSTETLFLLFGIVVIALLVIFVFKPSFLPCQTGDTKTLTCQDGTQRISATCFDSNWHNNVVDCNSNPVIPNPTAQLRGCAFNEPACGNLYTCQNNQCVYTPVPTINFQSCTYNSQCPTGYFCASGICLTGNSPTPAPNPTPYVSYSGTCMSGFYWVAPSNTCYPNPTPTPSPSIVKNQACTTSLGNPGHYSGTICISDSGSHWGQTCLIPDQVCADLGGGVKTTCNIFAGFRCAFP